MIDTTTYLNLPFVYGGRDWAGVDCWGMCKLVAWEEFGIDLPDYPQAGVVCGDIHYRTLAQATAEHVKEWREVDVPRPGDVVLLTPRSLPIHVGLVVSGKPYQMLHTERNKGPSVERVDSIRWRDRVDGFYRYG